jgi:hypothetical protein
MMKKVQLQARAREASRRRWARQRNSTRLAPEAQASIDRALARIDQAAAEFKGES